MFFLFGCTNLSPVYSNCLSCLSYLCQTQENCIFNAYFDCEQQLRVPIIKSAVAPLTSQPKQRKSIVFLLQKETKAY